MAREAKFRVPTNSFWVRVPEQPWNLSVDVELPLLPVTPDGGDPVCIKKAVTRYHQITLSEWASFIPHALTFNFNEFTQQPDWYDAVCSVAVRNQVDTVSRLEQNVADVFRGSSLGSITGRKGSQDKRQWLVIGDPELVGRNPGGDIRGMIEVKMFRDVEIKGKELVTLFNECRLHEPTARAIAQLVGYMIDNHCKYGALSTYNETRFLCAIDWDHIAISEAVSADAETSVSIPCVTLRRAFGYWLHLCNQPDALLLSYESSSTTRTTTSCGEPVLKKRHVDELLCCVAPAAGSCSLQSGNDVLQSSSMRPSVCETSFQGGPHTSLACESKCHPESRGGQVNSALLADVASHKLFVSWSELQIIALIGAGRCGCVALARRGGGGGRSLEFALKLFDVGKSVEGFEQELRVYTMLQASNAKAPKLLLVTHSPSEQVFGLGLQLGRPLPPSESWSRKHLKGAMAALRSLLAVGIVQNDVREYNFIEDNDDGKVLAIDFEDTAVVSTAAATTTTNDQDDADPFLIPEAPPHYLQRAWEELAPTR